MLEGLQMGPGTEGMRRWTQQNQGKRELLFWTCVGLHSSPLCSPEECCPALLYPASFIGGFISIWFCSPLLFCSHRHFICNSTISHICVSCRFFVAEVCCDSQNCCSFYSFMNSGTLVDPQLLMHVTLQRSEGIYPAISCTKSSIAPWCER